jgi:tetratricopeptide (TPR) repeat protein
VRAHACGCLAEAREWAGDGLEMDARDPELLLVMGAVEELRGSLWSPFPVRIPATAPERVRNELMKADRDRRALLENARASLEAALRAQPDHHEARLRLGRVEWRLGRLAPAREALAAVVRDAREARLLFLAHLFLGQVQEDGGRLEDAARSYREALALRPAAQSAGVALAHVLAQSGRSAEARAALETALAYAGEPDRADDLWEYGLGSMARAEELMAALRAEAQP